MFNPTKTTIFALVAAGILGASPISDAAGTDSESADVRESPSTETTALTEALTLDRFERCERADDPRASVEILLHGEAPASMQAAEFRSTSSLAARGHLARLLGVDDASGLVCREIEAPLGDVEYEVDVTFEGPGTEPRIAAVDVVKRNLTAEVANKSGDRCLTNVMGQTSCASAPNGVAVRSALGKILCARGHCVQNRGAVWRCSRAAGGWAEVTRNGFRCQQGCYSPTAGQCRKL